MARILAVCYCLESVFRPLITVDHTNIWVMLTERPIQPSLEDYWNLFSTTLHPLHENGDRSAELRDIVESILTGDVNINDESLMPKLWKHAVLWFSWCFVGAP